MSGSFRERQASRRHHLRPRLLSSVEEVVPRIQTHFSRVRLLLLVSHQAWDSSPFSRTVFKNWLSAPVPLITTSGQFQF